MSFRVSFCSVTGKALMSPIEFDDWREALKFVREFNGDLTPSTPVEPNLPNSKPLEEPEPYQRTSLKAELVLAEDLHVQDLILNPVVDTETPQEIVDTPDEPEPMTMAEIRSQMPRFDLATVEPEYEPVTGIPVTEPATVVDQMAEAASRVEPSQERTALKDEFRRVWQQSGFSHRALEEAIGKGASWVKNRTGSQVWPTQADIDLLASGVEKCRAAAGIFEHGSRVEFLRTVTLSPEATLRLCDLAAMGLTDALCAFRMKEFSNLKEQVDLTVSDVAAFRSKRSADISALSTAMGLSRATHQSVLDEIGKALKAEGPFTFSHQREAVA